MKWLYKSFACYLKLCCLFFHNQVVRVLYISPLQGICRYMYCKYFLWDYLLPLSFLNKYLPVLNAEKVQCHLCVCVCMFCVLSTKTVHSFSFMIYSRNFIILPFIIRSMIHFKIHFVSLWLMINFFSIQISNVVHHLLKSILFPFDGLNTSIENQLTLYMWF